MDSKMVTSDPFSLVSLGASVAIVLHTCSSVMANMNNADLDVCLPLKMHYMNTEYPWAGSDQCRPISHDFVEHQAFNVS